MASPVENVEGSEGMDVRVTFSQYSLLVSDPQTCVLTLLGQLYGARQASPGEGMKGTGGSRGMQGSPWRPLLLPPLSQTKMKKKEKDLSSTSMHYEILSETSNKSKEIVSGEEVSTRERKVRGSNGKIDWEKRGLKPEATTNKAAGESKLTKGEKEGKGKSAGAADRNGSGIDATAHNTNDINKKVVPDKSLENSSGDSFEAFIPAQGLMPGFTLRHMLPVLQVRDRRAIDTGSAYFEGPISSPLPRHPMCDGS